MKVLINGLGNIGTTLANILLEFKNLLGIETVYLYKNLPNRWSEEDLAILKSKGGVICKETDVEAKKVFLELISKVDFIFNAEKVLNLLKTEFTMTSCQI